MPFSPIGGLSARSCIWGPLAAVVVLMVSLAPVRAGAMPLFGLQPAGGARIEPQAGTWQTWVLTSGSQFRPAPPPDAADTQSELDQLRPLAEQRDPAALDQIAFWGTGAPSYRWNELAVSEALKHNYNSNFGTRALALVHVALSDAMVATCDAKCAYQSLRPSEIDPSLTTVVPTPASPPIRPSTRQLRQLHRQSWLTFSLMTLSYSSAKPMRSTAHG